MANPVYVNAAPDPRPGSRGYFVWYWTVSAEGRSKWVHAIHPWYTLRSLLAKHIPDLPAQYLEEITTRWYFYVFHRYPAEVKGKNPVGKG
jgi:hypothetical protein